MSLSLFSNSTDNLLPHRGEAYYYEQVFTHEECETLLTRLKDNINWKQEPIKLFGKEVMQPRLTSWYANEGTTYSYSGITMHGNVWTPELNSIKNRLEKITGESFNSALLNLYRHGNDSMGWHRDNERELGLNPVIASVSFGAVRKFQLRNYNDKTNLLSLNLEPGSCLLMKGETQHHWEHRVPKTTQTVSERINITFRRVRIG